MQIHELLSDAARRPLDLADAVLDHLDADVAHSLTGGTGNSIAWLLWHAARQMDVQTAALSGRPTVWETGGWADRLGVDRAADDFGFGDALSDVAALRVADVSALAEHLRACVDALTEYVSRLSPEDLDDVVDTAYRPHVTRGVRLVSIVDDAVVHVGQAAYARGVLEGWRHAV